MRFQCICSGSYYDGFWVITYPIKTPQLCIVSVQLHSTSLSCIAPLASHVCLPLSHNWLHTRDCKVWDELTIFSSPWYSGFHPLLPSLQNPVARVLQTMFVMLSQGEVMNQLVI